MVYLTVLTLAHNIFVIFTLRFNLDLTCELHIHLGLSIFIFGVFIETEEQPIYR